MFQLLRRHREFLLRQRCAAAVRKTGFMTRGDRRLAKRISLSTHQQSPGARQHDRRYRFIHPNAGAFVFPRGATRRQAVCTVELSSATNE